jgi:CHAD domain-containing protein
MAQRTYQDYAKNLIAYIERQKKRFNSNLTKALETGDVEAVHDVRVASRRLTEPLRLLGRWTGRRAADRVTDALRRTRRAFRKVRDLDVVQASLCDESPAGRMNPEDMAQLEGILAGRRERALRSARRRTEQLQPLEAIERMDDLIAAFEKRIDERADEHVLQGVDDFMSRWMARLRDKDPRRSGSADLHETRLCVKRLRYASELRRDIEGREEDRLVKALTEVQELLGHWNDKLITAGRVARIARKSEALASQSAWAAGLLECASQRARSAEEDRHRINAKWQEFEETLRSTRPTWEAQPAPGASDGITLGSSGPE